MHASAHLDIQHRPRGLDMLVQRLRLPPPKLSEMGVLIGDADVVESLAVSYQVNDLQWQLMNC